MTLRKILPASLLLLAAACATPVQTTSTESVGMDKAATKKSCCSDMSADKKAHCDMDKGDCCDKDKAAAPAETPKP